MNLREQLQWCAEQHANTNHRYDGKPYIVHLDHVTHVAGRFLYLRPVEPHVLLLACAGHDLIEDTRTTYSQVKEVLGQEAADIIYALTNEKGRNRKERANEKYYQGIRETPGAVFVKLCDRIANVEYSVEHGSPQLEMYRKEQAYFIYRLTPDAFGNTYANMVEYLENLLRTTK